MTKADDAQTLYCFLTTLGPQTQTATVALYHRTKMQFDEVYLCGLVDGREHFRKMSPMRQKNPKYFSISYPDGKRITGDLPFTKVGNVGSFVFTLLRVEPLTFRGGSALSTLDVLRNAKRLGAKLQGSVQELCCVLRYRRREVQRLQCCDASPNAASPKDASSNADSPKDASPSPNVRSEQDDDGEPPAVQLCLCCRCVVGDVCECECACDGVDALSESMGSSDSEGLLYECEFGCGFTGSYDDTYLHELTHRGVRSVDLQATIEETPRDRYEFDLQGDYVRIPRSVCVDRGVRVTIRNGVLLPPDSALERQRSHTPLVTLLSSSAEVILENIRLYGANPIQNCFDNGHFGTVHWHNSHITIPRSHTRMRGNDGMQAYMGNSGNTNPAADYAVDPAADSATILIESRLSTFDNEPITVNVPSSATHSDLIELFVHVFCASAPTCILVDGNRMEQPETYGDCLRRIDRVSFERPVIVIGN